MLPIIITVSIFSIYFLFLVWSNKLYLIDFHCDSKSANLKYTNGKKEVDLTVPINQIQIQLKNTTTRFGFNCDLILKINDKKFIINDTFNWSLTEIKLLFEYVKHFKNEPLTENDKFNLQKINEKCKR